MCCWSVKTNHKHMSLIVVSVTRETSQEYNTNRSKKKIYGTLVNFSRFGILIIFHFIWILFHLVVTQVQLQQQQQQQQHSSCCCVLRLWTKENSENFKRFFLTYEKARQNPHQNLESKMILVLGHVMMLKALHVWAKKE